MSQKLNIGQKFEDFSSFEIAIQQYQNAENVQFFRRNSRTIAKAQPWMPEKKLIMPEVLRDSVSLYTGRKEF